MMSQPFMFIFAIVVVALILFFGFNSITKLKVRGDFLILSSSVVDLKNDVSRYYSFDEGATKTLRLDLPKQVDQVCFVDPDDYMNDHEYKKLFEASKGYNVYILPLDVFQVTRFNIPYMKPRINPLCIKNFGKVELKLINHGSFVELSQK